METRIADYGIEHTSPLDGGLAQVAEVTNAQTEWPEMMSGLVEARLLQTLVRLARATRVLEVGTFTGLGSLAIVEAMPPDGHVTTVEANPDNATLAQAHFEAHQMGERVELLRGNALEVLSTLPGPFDLAYIDAWKPDYPAYFELVLPLLAPGGIMVFDNALHGGRALDASDPVGAFNDMVHLDDRVGNVLLTIGDGVLLAWPHAPAI